MGFLLLISVSAVGAYSWWSYHFRAAEHELAANEVESAHRHIARCLSLRPKHEASLLLAARSARLAGDVNAAGQYLDSLRRAKGEASEDVQLEYVLLRALTGEFEQVESGLINCVRQNHPRKEEVLETLAQCYMRDFELLKAQGHDQALD